jgi:hypothetical protein
LKNRAYVGRDEYPSTLTEAYDLMVRRSGAFGTSVGGRGFGGRSNNGGRGNGGRNFQFLQNGGNSYSSDYDSPPDGAKLVPGRDGKTVPFKCYNCNAWGYISKQCSLPDKQAQPKNGLGLAQIGTSFSMGGNQIPQSWILLDTCSTVSVACNQDLVTNIRDCASEECLTVHTNGGSQFFNRMGMLMVMPIPVHFNPDSMANILSMKDVVSLPGVTVTMDSSKERALLVSFGTSELKFTECSEGLYFYDVNNINKPKALLTNYSLLETVEDNKSYFSPSEIKGAETARKIQQEIGWPSTAFFKTIIANNHTKNSPITVDDINRAELIFGTPTPLLQGKMTRVRPTKNKIEKIPLPLPIAKHHKDIELYIDFFFINGHPFLHTKSSKVNFLTADICTSRSKAQIINTLEIVRQTYEARGFNITAIHGDNEFNIEALRTSILPATLHIYGKDEHVGKIERSIRTVKERARMSCHSLPYKKVPKIMVKALVDTVIQWLNAFPSETGVSRNMSPSTIVQGIPSPDMNTKRIVYGSYAMVYIGTKNNMTRRSVPAIAMSPSNKHGGHHFMSLYTGKKLHSYEWKELPIDMEVIARV